jgi:hypothetical protein
VINFALLVPDDGTVGSGCDIKGRAKDIPDAYERETVLLLKHLPTLRQVKEARSLVYELVADHDMSPDVVATQAGSLNLLADEVWYLEKRHQGISPSSALASTRIVPEIGSPSDQ